MRGRDLITSALQNFDRISDYLSSAVEQYDDHLAVDKALSLAVAGHLSLLVQLEALESVALSESERVDKETLEQTFTKMESIFFKLLSNLTHRHQLTNGRFIVHVVVGEHSVKIYKVVLFYAASRKVVCVYETLNERYAVQLAQAWLKWQGEPGIDVKLLAILHNGAVIDCPQTK